jgi:hypothetical protein
VIAYLRDVAEREQQAAMLDRTEQNFGMLARMASYIEVKPRVFGVAIDLKAVLRDIAEHRRR